MVFLGLTLAATITVAVIAGPLGSDYRFDGRPFLFIAVILAAWLGGLRAGFLATVLAAFAAYSLTEPHNTLELSKLEDPLLLSLLFTGLLVSAFSSWFSRTRARMLSARKETDFLHQTAEAVLRARTQEEIAKTAVTAAFSQFVASAAFIAVRGPATSSFRLLASEGYGPGMIDTWKLPAGTPVADAFFLQRPILSNQPAELKRAYPKLYEDWNTAPRPVAALPLSVKGRQHGVLCLELPSGRRFRDSEIRLLIAFANEVAQGLDAAELLASANRQSQEFQVLSEASRAFSESELEAESIFRKLVDLGSAHLGDFAIAYKISEDRHFLEPGATSYRNEQGEAHGRHPRPGRLAVGEGLSGGVAISGRGRVMLQRAPELREEERNQDEPSSTEPCSTISVPIVARGETFGVLTIERRGTEPFEGTHAELAQEIARRAGLALAATKESVEAHLELRRRRRVEEELRENQRELRAALDAKNEFLGLVSHELRTPLTVIHGNADVLRRRSNLSESDRDQALLDISVDSERLQRIVENMLYLARLDVGKVPDLEPVLLYRVLTEATEEFVRGIQEANVRLCSIPKGIVVRGNEGYIRQILQNLLSNAMKYSPPLSPIDIEVKVSGHAANVAVCDRGIGISSEKLSELFKPFYRANESGSHISGLGIGLAVCKRLVEAQGGEIEAYAREDGGSVFSFSLLLWSDVKD